MAQDTINTQFDFSGFNTLKKDLREATVLYQQMVASGQATAEQIKEQASRVAQLKDNIDDANDAVKAMTGAGQFQAFGRAISAAAGGFTALQGAITLAGGETKDFQETMVKLQAALAISQGISQLEDLGNAFGNVKRVAVNAFTAIKTAIGSTGIGLLVVALGAIVAYWDEIKAAVSGVSEEQNNLNRETAQNLKLNQDNLDALEGSEETLKLQGKTEEDIYNLKIDQYDQTIAAARASLENAKITKNAQIDAAKRNKEILQGIIRYLFAPLSLILATVDQIGKALNKDFGLEEKFSGGIARLLFDPEEVKEKADATIAEAEKGLRALENKRAGYINTRNAKIRSENNQAAKDAQDAAKKQEEIAENSARRTAEIKDRIGQLQIDDEKLRNIQALKDANRRAEATLRAEIERYEATKKIRKLTEQEERALAALREELIQTAAANRTVEAQMEFAYLKFMEEQMQEEARKRAEEFARRTKDEFNQTLTSLEDYFNEEETLILQNAAKTEETEIETQRKLRDLRIKDLEARIIAFKDYGVSVTELEKQLAELRLGIARDEAKKRLKIDTELFEGVMRTASSITTAIGAMQEARMAEELEAAGDNAAKREEIEKKYFEKNKQVQKAETIIDTLTSAVAAYKALAGIPVVGPALGAIAAAAALATGYARVREIEATTFQSSGTSGSTVSTGSKFAGGGLLTGPSHQQGGMKSMLGELEGGEFVVNRIATQAFMPLLEEINSMGQSNSERMLNPAPTSQTPIIKTYVVATDMDSALEKKRKIEKLARL